MNRFNSLILCTCIALTLESGYCQLVNNNEQETDYLRKSTVPAQPSKSTWKFVDELRAPYWTKIDWERQQPKSDEANLSKGIRLSAQFVDTKRLLNSAYKDLSNFLLAGQITSEKANYIIKTVMDPALKNESFKLKITKDSTIIMAGVTEGIRRGIFHLEDKMLVNGGPFLKIGSSTHIQRVQRRISRCFFSPIKRPGNQSNLGDELLDDIDYYPEEYLNRLAHEGVNGLWVTVSSKDGNETSVGFSDLVSTDITNDPGESGKKRLAKLNQIVTKCLNYGIRIYIKTMEPHVRFKNEDPILKKFPDLAANPRGAYSYLCASGTTGQKYLYEATNKIFSAVPELGGIINISHGELYTSCLSALPATGGGKVDCPRCSKIPEWKILDYSLTAMQKGMKDANPNAELISWLYMPQPQSQSKKSVDTLANWVYDIAAHTPKGVILQFNFESGVETTVFGKKLIGGDYWLSNPGPSSRFEKIARSAVSKGTQVSAKIQTSTSHEIATVPFIPAPSLIYKKFRSMRELGVTHTMLSWIMGSYPSIMIKAAERLSFEPFPLSENAFLKELATVYWKKEDIGKVIQAWKYFSAGYQNYPLSNMFQYFGPMHDGTVWPLLLRPVDLPLSPTYQLGSRNTFLPWPPSGDRIGEAFTERLTLAEMVSLCKKLSTTWDKGLLLMKTLERKYQHNHDRSIDIGVATALGIQFRTGYNILNFYLLREKLFRMDVKQRKARLSVLHEMQNIVEQEITHSNQLANLSTKDSRLGFHPEAEGYKYFPEKLKWREKQLKDLLTTDFPALTALIRGDKLLFPEYTGLSPQGQVAHANTVKKSNGNKASAPELQWNPFPSHTKSGLHWAASYDADSLYFFISKKNNSDLQPSDLNISKAEVQIEPRRLWPAKTFYLTLHTTLVNSNLNQKPSYVAAARVPLNDILNHGEKLGPIRINMAVTEQGKINHWKPVHPITPRLLLGTANPNDLDWLIPMP